MKTLALALVGVLAISAATAVPANACPPGYVPVKVQGNWLCRIDAVSPGLKLKLKLG